MNLNRSGDAPAPAHPPESEGKIPLRSAVIAITATLAGMGTWHRTSDYLITVVVGVLVAAVLGTQIADSPGNGS